MCSGCGLPKAETFAPPPADWPYTLGHWEDRYDTHVLTCAACASLQRKARAAHSGHGSLTVGQYFAVVAPDFNGDS